jgi:hypothetical protein
LNKFKPSRPIRLHTDDANFVSKDSELIDRAVREHIDIGGVVVYAYRYLTTPPQGRDEINVRTDPEFIQPIDIGSFMGLEDEIFLENRDRVYDMNDVPRLRGVFKVSQNDLIYGRFGAQGMNNDVFSIEFHTRTVEENLGRRFIMGDVLEFPHLQDISVSGNIVPKLYEVARVMRSPSGWDQHYVNHVLALTLRPVRDQQEFTQFMERMDKYGKKLVDQASTGPTIVELNDQLAQKAAEIAPDGPWDTTQIYFDPHDLNRRPNWWIDNGKPPNGIPVQSGTSFPPSPAEFDWFLRNDMVPNRLYQFFNNRWRVRQFDKDLTWQNYGWIKKYNDFLHKTDDTEV